MMKRIVLGLVFCLVSTLAWGQISPEPVVTTPSGGTIAVTGTFQMVIPYFRQRRGGYFQNNGTQTMFVYLASNAQNCNAATEAHSIQLQAPTTTSQGGSISLAYSGIVVTDAVCVAGTGGDAYSYGTQ